MAPLKLFSISLLLLGASIAAALVIVLQTPATGITFDRQRADGLKVLSIDPASPNIDRVQVGDQFHAFRDASGDAIEVNPDVLIEEPDQIVLFRDYNKLLAQQTQLANLLSRGFLDVKPDDGDWVRLETHPKHFHNIPIQFWLQAVLVPVSSIMIAMAVWVFRQQSRPARFLLVSAVGISLSAQCAAIYGVRELALDGDLFRWLSLFNAFGASMFTAGFFGLIWFFPRKLGSTRWVWIASGVLILGWLGNLFQWVDDTATVFYVPVLTVFLPTFFLAWLQWQKAADSPVDRASLKWFLLSVFLGTSAFAGVILIPTALGMRPVASQGVMFVFFVVMFIGVALGIVRYRLFDLGRWWLKIWLWVLGGASVILLDLLLVPLFGLQTEEGLLIALAVIGWIYFPARQMLWEKFQPKTSQQNQMVQLISNILTVESAQRLAEAWPRLVKEQFAALQQSDAPDSAQPATFDNDAQTLYVDHLNDAGCFSVSYPDSGRRLFQRTDLETLDLSRQIVSHVYRSMVLRDQAVDAERQRIMQDLHDDLGSKLLSFVYLSNQPDLKSLAREAMQDMRDILADLDAQPLSLSESQSRWLADIEKRLQGHDISFHAKAIDTQAEPIELPTIVLTNISRILREVVTNAMKHQHTIHISYQSDLKEQRLILTLRLRASHAIEVSPGDWQKARGLKGIARRAAQIGAQVTWDLESDCLVFVLGLQLDYGLVLLPDAHRYRRCGNFAGD